jgi:hypothetical protein
MSLNSLGHRARTYKERKEKEEGKEGREEGGGGREEGGEGKGKGRKRRVQFLCLKPPQCI